MTDDDKALVERLRVPCFEIGLDEGWIDAQRAKAADRIEALSAEIERLRVDAQAQYHRGYYDGRTALGETE